MTFAIPHANLVLAWLWIVLGFASGASLGMRFHDENWLGGYASHKRRLYRLAHISFFGLAIINLLFYFTVRHQPAIHGALVVAAWGFILGAATMPICCLIMAHHTSCRLLFAVPVSGLLVGGLLTLWGVIKL